jgi:hypothetical protein
MINFLRNLFREKKQDIKEISIEELSSWLKEKKEAMYKETQDSLNAFEQEFKQILLNAKESIAKLQAAGLHNPNISTREIQFMEGNRNFYIKRIQACLQHVEFPKTIDDIEKLYSSFNLELDNLGRSSMRSYQILQQFFEHEAASVAAHIKELDVLYKKLKELYDSSEVKQVCKLEKELSEFNITLKHKDALEGELLDLNDEIDDVKDELEEKKDGQKKLEISDEKKELDLLKIGRDEIMTDLKALESTLNHSFSILEMALKKYARMTMEYKEIADDYLANPIKALVKDHEFRILEILPKMKTLIMNGVIDLKDRKKEKTLEVIDELKRETLAELVRSYKETKHTVKSIEEKIEASGFFKKKEQYMQSIKELSVKMDRFLMQKGKLSKDVNPSEIIRLKKALETEIAQLFKIELRIV